MQLRLPSCAPQPTCNLLQNLIVLHSHHCLSALTFFVFSILKAVRRLFAFVLHRVFIIPIPSSSNLPFRYTDPNASSNLQEPSPRYSRPSPRPIDRGQSQAMDINSQRPVLGGLRRDSHSFAMHERTVQPEGPQRYRYSRLPIKIAKFFTRSEIPH